MRLSKDKLNRRTVHFRLPSVAKTRRLRKLPSVSIRPKAKSICKTFWEGTIEGHENIDDLTRFDEALSIRPKTKSICKY